MEEKIHRAKKRIWNDICSLKYCIILLAVYAVATQLAFGTVCPMVIFCGLPCPGCGLTRAVCSILLGDLKSAVEYNLTAFLWLPFLLLLLWERYLTAKKYSPPEGNNFCCTGYGGILSLQNEDVLSGRASFGLSARKYHGMDFAGKYINYRYRA